MRNRGRLEDSEKLLKQALEIAAKEPVRDANYLAEVRSNQGVLLAEQGQHEQAKTLLTQTLADHIGAVGEKNALIAADRYKLARVLIVLKEWEGEDGADTLLAKSEETLMRVYGEAHLRTAKCFEAIAELRLVQGKHDDAASYAMRVLTIREKTLPAPIQKSSSR